MNKTYSDKLKDPRWQKKRLEIMQRDGFACLFCGNKDETLHIHHRWYEKGNQPWDYPDEVYQTLCEKCHVEAESMLFEIRQLASSSRYAMESTLHLVNALCGIPAESGAAIRVASLFAVLDDLRVKPTITDQEKEAALTQLGRVTSMIGHYAYKILATREQQEDYAKGLPFEHPSDQ